MDLEKGDSVVLDDKHSEFDGETGKITQVAETMFGDKNYTINFDDGQETGVPEDAVEPVVAETVAEDAPEEDAPEEDAPEEDAPEEDAPEEDATGATLDEEAE